MKKVYFKIKEVMMEGRRQNYEQPKRLNAALSSSSSPVNANDKYQACVVLFANDGTK
ncbi:hypothetical protein PGB90_006701 [Kerria lacca]